MRDPLLRSPISHVNVSARQLNVGRLGVAPSLSSADLWQAGGHLFVYVVPFEGGEAANEINGNLCLKPEVNACGMPAHISQPVLKDT